MAILNTYSPGSPIPNNPFYTPTTYDLTSSYGSLVVGSGLNISPTGVITAAGGGGGGGGTVKKITVSLPLLSSPAAIVEEGNISLAPSGVFAGTYTYPVIQVDIYGRILNITSAPITPVSGITAQPPLFITGAAASPTLNISVATTSQLGVTQLVDSTSYQGSDRALAARQGYLLQQQIDNLLASSNLKLAGSINPALNQVVSVTNAGLTAGLTVGLPLPAPSTNTNNLFVILVSNAAQYTPPGGTTYFGVVSGDWVIGSNNTWSMILSGTRVNPASTTEAGIVRLATGAEAISLTDNNTAITPFALGQVTASQTTRGIVRTANVAETAAGLSCTLAVSPYSLSFSYVQNCCYVGKGNILVGTGASQYAAVPVGANGSALVADSSCAAGMYWGIPDRGITALTAGIGLGAPATGCVIRTTGTLDLLPPTATAIGGVKSGPIIYAAADGTLQANVATSLDPGIVLVGPNLCNNFGEISVPNASSTVRGVTRLNNSYAATTTTEAATPKAVNDVYIVACNALPKACFTEKGVIVTSSAACTPLPLLLGSQGQVLQVDTTCPSGMKWGPSGTAVATPVCRGIVFGSTPTYQDGTESVSLGSQSGASWSTVVTDSVAIGQASQVYVAGGSRNTSLGSLSLGTAATATDNVALGFRSLAATPFSTENTAVGSYALALADTSSANTAVGFKALCGVTLGVGKNVAIGWCAGTNLICGSGNVLIGNEIAVPDPLADQQLVIGSCTTLCWLTGDNTGAIRPQHGIKDCTGSAGALGQVLTSTGTNKLAWCTITFPPSIPCACITAKGTLVTGSGPNAVVSLGVGADGQSLTACAACPLGLAWVTPPTSNAIPCACITGVGTIVTGTAADTPVALPVGTTGQVLAVDLTCAEGLKWCSITSQAIPCSILTAKGSLLTATAASTPSALPVGTNGQLLVACSTAANGICWCSPTFDYTPIGSVQFFAMNTIPDGWLVAAGQAVSRTLYPQLFLCIGTTYGSGDGSTTFNLPDLRGMFLRGFDAAGGTARNCDAGRVFGSTQQDSIRCHQHVMPYGETGTRPFGQTATAGKLGNSSTLDNDNFWWYTNDGTNYDGTLNPLGVIACETRAKNVAMLPCIKASYSGSLPSGSGVVPGPYKMANIVVNASGAITGASNGTDITILGCNAGCAITTGTDNVIIGKSALQLITTGSKNVAIGPDVSLANGSCQLAIGFSATDNWLTGDSSKNIRPGAGITDCAGVVGTNGQVLTSTGSKIIWQTPAVASDWISAGTIEAVGITGTSSSPTMGTVEANSVSYRPLGPKTWEVTLILRRSVNTGSAAGSGDYLFTLPNALSWSTTTPWQTAVTGNINANNQVLWYQYMVPTSQGYITNSSSSFVSSKGVGVVPFDATRYRIVASAISGAVDEFRPLGSTYYAINTSTLTWRVYFQFTSA